MEFFFEYGYFNRLFVLSVNVGWQVGFVESECGFEDGYFMSELCDQHGLGVPVNLRGVLDLPRPTGILQSVQTLYEVTPHWRQTCNHHCLAVSP